LEKLGFCRIFDAPTYYSKTRSAQGCNSLSHFGIFVAANRQVIHSIDTISDNQER
jgi:hypothetical protein